MALKFDDMSPDDIQLFIAEAEEQLALLEANILRLEQEETGQEIMQDMFRAAHTLKGSSATLGHRRMTELAHGMENVMDKVRKNELAVSLAVTEALFMALDGLRLLKDEVIDGNEREVDLAGLVGGLNAVMTRSKPAAAEAAKPAAAPSSSSAIPDEVLAVLREAVFNTGGIPYALTASLEENCMMSSIRMFQVMGALKELGEVAASKPLESEIEAGDDLGHVLKAYVVSFEPDEKIREIVGSIAEIERVLVEPVALGVGDKSAPEVPVDSAGEPSAESKAPASGPGSPGFAEQRGVDLGPAARGKSQEELQNISKKAAAQTVRVDVERLDNLMNLVGELVISKTRLAQLGAALGLQNSSDEFIDDLLMTSAQVGRITQELQSEILKARMLPVDTVFSKFPRMVRDLSQKAGKEVNFVVEGKETELDRSVMEVIGDPLIHTLRNALDHGLELPDERLAAGKARVGTVRLAACHEENNIVIRISDDGRGIDSQKLIASALKKGAITQEAADRMDEREALNLIFLSGLSTAKVVSDVSGRGVGMDIVRNNIEKLNGSLSIDTAIGKGTTFTIRLPLTLAIIQAMLVEVLGRIYAIPLTSVHETIKVGVDTIRSVNNREVVVLRGATLPLIRLKNRLRTTARQKKELAADGRGEQQKRAEKDWYIVVVGVSGKRVGFVVDKLVGKQEVVIKNLGRFVGDIRGFSGATILGNGRVALILDVPTIIDDEITERMTTAGV